jgi:hypothetical protein
MKMCVRNELLLWIDEKKNSGWDTRWCMGKVRVAVGLSINVSASCTRDSPDGGGRDVCCSCNT